MPVKHTPFTINIHAFADELFRSEDFAEKPNQLIQADELTVRRDPLSELQQRIITSAIAYLHGSGTTPPSATLAMDVSRFLQVCDLSIATAQRYGYLADELEKLLKKGLWLYDKTKVTITRTTWFQSVEYSDNEIVFQFSDKVLPLIFKLVPDSTMQGFVKGLQYKGKHTLAVFNIVWFWQGKGVVEYSIPELMQQLYLEHTRYSYGQLRLRVLEPAFEEIYAWDDAIFVRFGPTFSGRRVEGVWFEVTVGEEARALRRLEPAFKLASPDQKPGNIRGDLAQSAHE